MSLTKEEQLLEDLTDLRLFMEQLVDDRPQKLDWCSKKVNKLIEQVVEQLEKK